MGVPTPVPSAAGVVIRLSGLEESEACWARRLIWGVGGWPLLYLPVTTDAWNRCFSRTYIFESDSPLVVSVKTRALGRKGTGAGWLDSLLMAAVNSSMTERRYDPVPPRSEDGEGGVVEPG